MWQRWAALAWLGEAVTYWKTWQTEARRAHVSFGPCRRLEMLGRYGKAARRAGLPLGKEEKGSERLTVIRGGQPGDGVPHLLSFEALDARVSLQGEEIYGLRDWVCWGTPNFPAIYEDSNVTYHKPFKQPGVPRGSRSASQSWAHQPT